MTPGGGREGTVGKDNLVKVALDPGRKADANDCRAVAVALDPGSTVVIGRDNREGPPLLGPDRTLVVGRDIRLGAALLGPGRTAAPKSLSLLYGPGRTDPSVAAATRGGGAIHSCLIILGSATADAEATTSVRLMAGGSNLAAFSCGSGGRTSKAASDSRNICSMFLSVVGVSVGVVSVGTPAALLEDVGVRAGTMRDDPFVPPPK
jgi:hypothetical protein